MYGYFMILLYGSQFTLLTLVFFSTHFGFYVDRLRHFTEHNLMPLENKNGARSFGLGFWGLLIGGGPWGQACHWMHHLVPGIPWYQQLMLHRYAVNLLTPRQREQFMLEPFFGFPKLFWRLWKEPNSFMSKNKSFTAREM
jgi:fatty acid desaturase